MSGAKKGVSGLGRALDAQRFAVAKKAGLGATPDEQMTNLRKKLGVEQSYQDPKLFGIIPQPHALHHFEQGIFDAALGTVTDPLTYETLGVGPFVKGATKVLPSLGEVATKTRLGPLYDFFTHGGPAKRKFGVDTVENVLGAKGKVLTQGQATAQRYSKPIEAAMGKLPDSSKVRVARWMDGQLPFDQLDAAEQQAATRMRRWTESMHKVDLATHPQGAQAVGDRQEYFPGVQDTSAGSPAHEFNLLEQSAPHLMQRGVRHVLPEDATAEQVMEALQGRAQGGARMATSRRLEAEVRQTLGLKPGETIPDEIKALFVGKSRATGQARSDPEFWSDVWRTVVTAPKAAVVGTGPRHMANIASLAANQPGGITALAKSVPTFARLMKNPSQRNALLKKGIDLGAIEPNPERSTAVIDLLKKAPGPLGLPGKAMEGMNRATWSFDDAMAQALAEQFAKRGKQGYQAGRAARRGLVDYENLSPFAEKAKHVMPFASFATGIPKAVASGVARDPRRAAALNRATGGAFYGSDYQDDSGTKYRSYLPPSEMGRIFDNPAAPFRYARKSLSPAVTDPAGAVESAVEHGINLPANLFKPHGKYPAKLPFSTGGQDPLTKKGSLTLLLELLSSGTPEARTILQQLGKGRYPAQSFEDILTQQAGGQLPLR